MITREHFQTFSWIDIDIDEVRDAEKIALDFGIDPEVAAYALDKNELAHVEYNRKTGQLILIYHVLKLTKEDNSFQTIPLTFIAQGDRLISMSTKDTDYIVRRLQGIAEDKRDMSLYDFLFSGLIEIANPYFSVVEKLTHERQVINQQLRAKTTKQGLLALSDIETGNVFLLSASRQNAVIIERLKNQSLYFHLSESEKELLDDALVEANQLVEMTKLTSEILEQLTATYNNILNNDLNDTMTMLTIVSLLMTIPSIVTGFFGINVPLPKVFTDSPYGWILVILLSMFLWMVMSKILTYMMGQSFLMSFKQFFRMAFKSKRRY
ncbi:magnesium transporter [Streptococcus agalactiae LMG 14747]|uniref:Magnesium transporter n=2 Tax=Streptococcus TaxID=1301 RepID=V6Z1A4_STRAG|nr:magnesium transporter CorA family protein [Streptococcus acidominimus]ESV54735.1 magnesium transporter [Streptococcus agalactiae LMG 14747]SNV37394.1 CorA-like protein [Streptococcus acidominimus]